MYGKNWVVSTSAQKSVHGVTAKLGQMSKGNMRPLETKTKNVWKTKNSPFVLGILAVKKCNR